ncbi:GIY-YIG nuclease family protein [Candidatus Pelagisphaera phototrophica]|uniref:GIY-YIG nuclease family protein n=1 Tax=Candidatus Pelagisphaera phototrophica TaxID=2684113 RepID=UPI003CCE3ED4
MGSTQDVEKRLERHNSGIVYSTKCIGFPLKLIAYRTFDSNAESPAVEVMLKHWRNLAKATAFLSETI